MSSYTREFCSDCKRYAVFSNGKCIAHKGCVGCEVTLKLEDSRFEIRDRVYCKRCGEEKRIGYRYAVN